MTQYVKMIKYVIWNHGIPWLHLITSTSMFEPILSPKNWHVMLILDRSPAEAMTRFSAKRLDRSVPRLVMEKFGKTLGEAPKVVMGKGVSLGYTDFTLNLYVFPTSRDIKHTLSTKYWILLIAMKIKIMASGLFIFGVIQSCSFSGGFIWVLNETTK